MCGCDKHSNSLSPCTCICKEHKNFDLAQKLALARYDIIVGLNAQVADLEQTKAAWISRANALSEDRHKTATFLRGLIDSLDEHVTNEQIAQGLTELYRKVSHVLPPMQ